MMAENVELLHNLILLQQYVRELERNTGREKGRHSVLRWCVD